MACRRRQHKKYGNLRPGFREQIQAVGEIFRRTLLRPAYSSPVNRRDQSNAFSFYDSQLVRIAIQSFVMQDLFAEQLKALQAASLDRHLFEISSPQGPEITVVGHDRRARRLINFSSNDYLGLANDPRLREAAISALQEFGVGAGASRLISGTQPPHVRLERALAEWKGTEAALSFSSGYAAALGSIPALVTKNDVVLLDKLCHASLIDAAKLSGARLRIFLHNNLRKLESHLQWARHGRGLAATENLSDGVDVQMGTLSKALGAGGGYICGSHVLIEWLINRARSFVYSTAMPPAIAAAASAAIDFLLSPAGEERRLL